MVFIFVSNPIGKYSPDLILRSPNMTMAMALSGYGGPSLSARWQILISSAFKQTSLVSMLSILQFII